MQEVDLTLRTLAICLHEIIKPYGFSYNLKIKEILFDKLNEKGIPHDYVESVLVYDNELNLTELLNKIEKLESNWTD